MNRPPVNSRAQAGLTLVELLAAMAIFLGLAGMVLQVLGGGLDVWSRGERSRHSREAGSVILDRLERELREMVASMPGSWGEPDARLVCDFVQEDADRDGLFEFQAQRLMLVRHVYEERTHPLLLTAGDRGGPGAHYEGQGAYWEPSEAQELAAQDDPEAGTEEDAGGVYFLATEGRCEVCLVSLPDDRPGFEGRIVLWRALRSPVGGPGSLFRRLEYRNSSFLEDVPAEALAENLLHVSFDFIDSDTVDLAPEAGQGGPSRTWDSTRGILPAGEGPWAFRHAVGPESLEDPDDDVFPRAIQITVVVELPPDQSYEAELLDPLGAEERGAMVRVRNGGFLNELEDSPLYARIGHEWVELDAAGGGSVMVRRRGLFGTLDSAHPEGTKLLVGTRFERVVPIPVAREPAPREGAER